MLQIGVGWIKSSEKTEWFLSGTSTADADIVIRAGSQLVILPNDRKEPGTRQPDYLIFVAARQDQDAPAPPPTPRPADRTNDAPRGDRYRTAPAPPPPLAEDLEDPFAEGTPPVRGGQRPTQYQPRQAAPPRRAAEDL